MPVSPLTQPAHVSIVCDESGGGDGVGVKPGVGVGVIDGKGVALGTLDGAVLGATAGEPGSGDPPPPPPQAASAPATAKSPRTPRARNALLIRFRA